MIQILRKYNKKILAVIGVFLMISFIADLGIRRYNRGLNEGVSPGKMGNEILSAAEHRYAYVAWQLLHGKELGYAAGNQLISIMDAQLAEKLAPAFANPFMGFQQALGTARQILQRLEPLDFLLLLKEAQRMNIRVSEDDVKRALAQLAELPSEDPDFRERVLRDWLTVFEAYSRIADTAKISQGMAIHQVAQNEQQVALKLVEFKVADFKSKVPPPTTQQIAEFFQKYKDSDPQTSETGVSYRYPDRVKLEYIRIPLAKVKEKVTDEDTYEYWKRNQSLFPTTQPADTQPSTNATTQPLAAASTQPTTRPWTEVKDQIRDRLAYDLAAAMAKSTLQTFNSDWATYRQAGQAANTPSSLNGVPFDSPVYLRRLSERVQTLKDSRNVLPETVQEGEWLTKQELTDLPGIGQSSILTQTRQPVPFADFAFERAALFMTDAQIKFAQQNQVQILNRNQPSLPFRGPEGSYYIFRLTAADRAHPATTVAEVESKVKTDWTTAQAFELAKAAARMSLETAKAQGIEAAAKAAGELPIIETGLFFNNPNYPIGKYNLPPSDKPKFLEAAFALLQDRLKTGNSHPLTVFDLPKTATSVLVRLDDAKPAVEHPGFSQQVAAMQRVLEGRQALGIAAAWFSPDAIQKRLDFKPSDPTATPTPRRDNQPAPPPLF